MNPFHKVLKSLIILTITVLIIAVALRFALPERFYSPALPYLVIFIFATQFILLKIIVETAKKKFKNFVNRFMVANFLKLFLYLVVILVYAYLNNSDILPFSVSFLALYVIYTIFEITILIKTFKSITSG